MRSNILFILLIAVVAMAAACGSSGPTPNNVAPANAANATNTDNDNAIKTVVSTPEPTTNNAPTLTPVYKAYCAAWVKKDEAALRKAYTAASLKEIEQQMKDEKVKTLVQFLALDKLSNEVCEVRNENIKGDSAVAEIKTKAYPNGIAVIFEKENGEWKLTTKSPTFDKVKTTGGISNVARPPQ